MTTLAAVDLGASSGRVVAGICTPTGMELREVHRFAHHPRRDGAGTLRWDLAGLSDGILAGLQRLARTFGTPASIGVDTWAVDYGLLDAEGRLVDDPVSYRDDSVGAAHAELLAVVGAEELWAVTGVATQPFNTIGRLMADERNGRLDQASSILLLPDLLGHWLTGVAGTETTNASTTGLFDVAKRRWAQALADRVAVDLTLFPPLRKPGRVLGRLRRSLLRDVGSPQVVTVASHDTASAVAAVPAAHGPVAFAATGTWSLVGLELATPVLSAQARTAGFTNELGCGDHIRFLRNVTGFWVLQQYVEEMRAVSPTVTVERLLAEAAELPDDQATFDIDDPSLASPGPMTERITAALRARDAAVPSRPAALARCIVASMASGISRALHDAVRLTGVTPRQLHLVGGGAQVPLLCQLVADTAGLPVVAGPVEATAWGNLLVQGQALDLIPDGLDAARAVVRAQCTPRTFVPARRVTGAR